MNANNEKHGLGERLVDAYNRMLERVRHGDSDGTLHHAIDKAQETATELGELTREEAQRIGDYLRRDLHDAARFMEESGNQLADWLSFDLDVVEKGLLDLFSAAVDQSRVELNEWTLRGNLLGEWRTGEVTSMGTLECKSCGERLTFTATVHIPPCPRCCGTVFRRVPE